MTIRTMASPDATLLCGGLVAACAGAILFTAWAYPIEFPRADRVAEVGTTSLQVSMLPASINDAFLLAKR
jgi:hypothetical protein